MSDPPKRAEGREDDPQEGTSGRILTRNVSWYSSRASASEMGDDDEADTYLGSEDGSVVSRQAVKDYQWDDEARTSKDKKRKRAESIRSLDALSTHSQEAAEAKRKRKAMEKKLCEVIKAVNSIARELTVHVAKNVNTKKEIKDGIAALRKKADELCSKEMGEFLDTIGDKMGVTLKDQDTQTVIGGITAPEKRSEGTQTVETSEEDIVQMDKINGMLDSEGDLGVIHEMIGEKWPIQCYKRTTTEKGSILDQEDRDMVIIHDCGPDESSRFIEELCEFNAQLEKLIKKDGMKAHLLYELRQHDMLTCEEEPDHRSDTDRIIYLCKLDHETGGCDKTKNILDILAKIKMKTMDNGRRRLAFATTKAVTTVGIRRLLEFLYREEEGDDLRVYGVPTRKRRTEKLGTGTDVDGRRGTERQQTEEEPKFLAGGKRGMETLRIKLNEGQKTNFATIVKGLKKGIDVDTLGVKIKNLRVNKEGLIHVGYTGNTENKGKFLSKVQECISEVGQGELVERMTTLFLKDLDETVDEEDIVSSITDVHGNAEVKITMARRSNRAGLRHAFVRLPCEIAAKVARMGYIRIGWTKCRVDQADSPIRCFNCSRYGHNAAACKVKETMVGRCLNCSQEGHLARECKNQPRCYVCKDNRDHKAQSLECPSYKAATVEWRRTKNTKPSASSTLGVQSRPVSILQLNFNRCRAAHDLIDAYITDNKIDVVLGCEPNGNAINLDLVDRFKDCFVRITSCRPLVSKFCGEGYVMAEFSDLVVFSCYFSPNASKDKFVRFLDDLSVHLGDLKGKRVVIGGDLNAKSAIFGSPVTNVRGKLLEEWMLAHGLIGFNAGGIPTFARKTGESIIDITLGNDLVAGDLEEWRVMEEEETLSDHRAVRFVVREIKSDRSRGSTERAKKEGKRWKLTVKNQAAFEGNLHDLFGAYEGQTCKEVMAKITQYCNRYLKKKGVPSRPAAYWWNARIKEIRDQCVAARRNVTRARKRLGKKDGSVMVAEHLSEIYKGKRKELKNEIKKSKNLKWKELCAEMENDVWGKAYQLTVKRLKIGTYKVVPEKTANEQATLLFPVGQNFTRNRIPIRDGEYPQIDKNELENALKSINPKKAPGPDGVTADIFRKIGEKHGDFLLGLYNWLFTRQLFPKIWKSAKLVLIEKPSKGPNEEPTYRPICLIDVAGKVYERIICDRLNAELEGKNALSNAQHGFRKRRSTISAMKQIENHVTARTRGQYGKMDFCAMVCLDVANAFNSAPWKGILSALKRKRISPYLRNLVDSYLSDRRIWVSGNATPYTMSCGVPQGSVLGPTLWNVFYDEILEMDGKIPAKLIAYADDLSVIVCAKDRETLEDRTVRAVSRVTAKLTEMGLNVSQAKTEVVMLSGRRKLRNFQIEVDGNALRSTEMVRYLGVYYGRDRNFGGHVRTIIERTTAKVNALSRIMPRIGGCSTARRRLLASVATSTVLYASSVWGHYADKRVHREKLDGLNRKLSIMTICGYRTISSSVAQVLAGMPPLDLLVRERAQLCGMGEDGADAEGARRDRGEVREEMLGIWQARWDAYEGHAKTFVNDVARWYGRSHGSLNYYVTQALSGHGVFGTYLKKIGKSRSDACWFCGARDTPAHTVFVCTHYDVYRDEAANLCRTRVTSENVADLLLRSEATWDAVVRMLGNIMQDKCAYERSLRASPSLPPDEAL
ncbi:uncharacterized protein [Euwallacea fornicatus]|uniref:uncharacterized protein n=1 Tax=Euwallacea fornicatus TaxID=995702 RepID=UPI00338FC02D